MSLDQHFDALIELLQDKPQKVMLETLRGFNARLAKAWTVRHNRPKKGRKVIAHSNMLGPIVMED